MKERMQAPWYSLLHDSFFIDLHLSESMKQPRCLVFYQFMEVSVSNILNNLVMVNRDEGDYKFREIPLMGFNSDELQVCRRFLIVGSCNGFLCLSVGINFVPPVSIIPSQENFHNKYKVVGISENFGEIITVGESRRRKKDLPRTFRVSNSRYPLFLDGIIYWFIERNVGDEYEILALDIGSEKFWTIKCPCPRENGCRRSLIEMDGSLAIIDYDHKFVEKNRYKARSMDVWLVEGSKTMGFSFNVSTYDMSGLHLHYAVCRDLLVMAKVDRDTFLVALFDVDKVPTVYSIILFSPVKQYLSILGTWTTRYMQTHWMVPTLKSLKAAIDT
ncbi:hypothetical protein NE237_021445 [Protea cynaroides]|uniref:F-box associated beta-propeller type 3 domain-containing protein n=1 Tax=Protea cynaroides TaxID=273540 RepID=A0A9Q0K4D1_9MAGN|nr:hypothetical protein NE237_021445 [Protea cynaroides]